jgi:hypothetical protein
MRPGYSPTCLIEGFESLWQAIGSSCARETAQDRGGHQSGKRTCPVSGGSCFISSHAPVNPAYVLTGLLHFLSPIERRVAVCSLRNCVKNLLLHCWVITTQYNYVVSISSKVC